MLQCSTCVDIFSCSYTLCIRLITCQSLLLPNTSTHLLESHPFPLSLLSSFVITLLFSSSFLPIRCVKPSFGTPSGSNLLFSPFSSLSKYPFHLHNILSRSLKSRGKSLARTLSLRRTPTTVADHGYTADSGSILIARCPQIIAGLARSIECNRTVWHNETR